jgi:glycosyltransferase involved in cell wall biosynthesis
MHLLGTVALGLIAVFWLTHGLRVAYGGAKLPRLQRFPLVAMKDCPKISVIFAARDEEEKLADALRTMLALDYPDLEIIAVDDRSTDATASILAEYAAKDARLKVVRIPALPAGWLGKPHALQQGYEASDGEWLLFTDADVQFAPDALRRAMSLVQARKLDHLTLMCQLQMKGFWEKVVLTFFGMTFHLSTDPQRVANPKSISYVGIGAFQLVRRSSYEASGTHKKLALEVVDDMKLAKIVREAGARSCVGVAQEHVSVRWHAGLENIVRGVSKNFFAAANFHLWLVIAHVLIILLVTVVPVVALPFVHGWVLAFAAISVTISVGFQACGAFVLKANPLYGLTQPVGAMIYLYMVMNSTVLTLRQGGIMWRGRFYSLEELRKRTG